MNKLVVPLLLTLAVGGFLFSCAEIPPRSIRRLPPGIPGCAAEPLAPARPSRD